jgi:hypothetical protein
MAPNTDEEQGALKLAEIIEETANNPEKAVQRIEKKIGPKAVLNDVFGKIIDFIKDYKNKDKDQSDEEWMEQQFAKPEYAAAWKDAEERKAAAQGLVQGIDDYESAKKSLLTHIKLGGNRASWLAEQIEIGAANNNKDLAEYAKEVSEGLKAAIEENAKFLLADDDTAKGAK